MEDQKKCTPYHTVNGYVPKAEDLHLNGQVCDCSRVVFYSERCGCPASVTPTYELKSKPNE